jgi:SAM-dependent methyltransferase
VTRTESNYFAHMQFDAEHIRRVRSHYVPLLESCAPVLELACGRGEFLTLLREKGVAVQGVDNDEGMVEEARRAGLPVVNRDVVEYLHGEPGPQSFGGVFCAHLLEHLPVSGVERLLAGVRRVLMPGGRFVAVVPNPACYAVLTHDFWRDPTHVRFYDAPLVEFLCAQAGLEVEECAANPLDHPGPPPGTEADLVMDDPQAYLDRLEEAGSRHRDEELAVLVEFLARRLAEVTQALRDLERAHRTLVWEMYQPNEIYVVARVPRA